MLIGKDWFGEITLTVVPLLVGSVFDNPFYCIRLSMKPNCALSTSYLPSFVFSSTYSGLRNGIGFSYYGKRLSSPYFVDHGLEINLHALVISLREILLTRIFICAH